MAIKKTGRVAAPFVVGQRVRQTFDGPAMFKARTGTVAAVRDEWAVRGLSNYQTIDVDFDMALGFRSTGTIAPWLSFEAI